MLNGVHGTQFVQCTEIHERDEIVFDEPNTGLGSQEQQRRRYSRNQMEQPRHPAYAASPPGLGL